jgi:hypothetical protein
MADENYRNERVKNGWIAAQRRDDGTWLLSWEPDQGHPDYPGRSFMPADPHLPDDFPAEPHDNPEVLLAWARERYARR